MKVIKYYCDACGKEYDSTELNSMTLVGHNYEVCKGCTTAFWHLFKSTDAPGKVQTLITYMITEDQRKAFWDDESLGKQEVIGRICQILKVKEDLEWYSSGSTVTKECFVAILNKLKEIF